MKATFQKPIWADHFWPERCEKASERIELLVEPAYCGQKIGDLFSPEDRIYKDIALILFGSDWPNLVDHVKELVLIFSEKCECKECAFHEIETA